MPEGPTRIMGIDPGTRNVGYGVIERDGSRVRRLASGCITAGNGDMAARLVTIHRALQEVIDAHRPQAAAIETVFTGDNPKTAIAIGEGRGVAVLSAAEKGLSVSGYEPALVKRAVAGSGRAGKEQVRRVITTLLQLPSPPETDHEADALAIAFTHAMHSRLPVAEGGKNAALARLRDRARSLPESVLKQLPPGLAPAPGNGARKRMAKKRR